MDDLINLPELTTDIFVNMMTTNGYRSGDYGDNGSFGRKEDKYGSKEKLGGELEKGPSIAAGSSSRGKPFGDNDEKYASMQWW